MEASDGLLYRWKSTTTESGANNVHQEACISGLAAVTTDRFFRPSVGRGIRGAAGTGRGVATVIDGLALAYRNDDLDDALHHEVAVELPLNLDRTIRAPGGQSVRASSCQFVPVRASSCQLVPVRASSCQLVPVRASSCQFVPVRAAL